jgi:hypothetical protein
MTEKLTEAEIKALREIITADARRQWLISGTKAVAVWVAAIGGGWLVFRQIVAEFLK